MVVYQAMYDTFQIYVRPLAMFMEEIDADQYPEARQKYRFELLQDMELTSSFCPQDAVCPKPVCTEHTEQGPEQDGDEEGQTEEQETDELQACGQTAESEEQLQIDPLVMEFLDADTYEQRLNILAALRHRITDEMINTMAVAVDLEIKDGEVEERYEELKSCLLTFEKYECNRLR